MESNQVLFRQIASEKTLRVGPHDWHYWRGGRGNVTCLFLHGLIGDGTDAAHLLTPLADELAFVAPTLPPLATLEELVQGLVAILDHENIERALVVGISFGGLMAQAFFHRRKERVADLLLGDSAPPNQRLGRRNQRNEWVWRVLPMAMLRWIFRLRMSSLLKVSGPLSAEAETILAETRQRFDLKVDRLQRATLVSQIVLANQMFREDPSDAADLRGWPGRVVILGPDDPPQLAAARVGLERIFPSARVIVIRGAGHLGSLLQRDLYLGAIRDLLRPRSV